MIREGLDRYEKGGYWRTDDITGARVRARDTKLQWDGAITDRDNWSPRHPQEFLRSKRDDQSVPKPRPVPPIIDGGPVTTQTTADAAAAATGVTVTASAGFHNGGRVGIMLDSGDRFLATITALPTATQIDFTPGLPGPCSSGAVVVDYATPTVSL